MEFIAETTITTSIAEDFAKNNPEAIFGALVNVVIIMVMIFVVLLIMSKFKPKGDNKGIDASTLTTKSDETKQMDDNVQTNTESSADYVDKKE